MSIMKKVLTVLLLLLLIVPIFAQEGAELTLNDFVSKDYTSSVGPSEAGNFFGLGSSIHVDGGDNKTAAKNTKNRTTSMRTIILLCASRT